MEYLYNGFQEAVRLLISGESGVYTIVGVSVFVAVSAILVASVMGLPAGYVLATRRFRGQRFVTTVLNTLLAMPTVVIGLFVYSLISRRGPLGFMELLYTPGAMIIGETLLALPIVAAFTLSAFRAVDSRISETALTLGATTAQTARTLISEARFGIMAAVVAAFGRVIAEVGAAMMLGGNIKGSTRTMTTAIALESNKGEFGLAIALGIILLLTAFGANILFHWLQGFDD
ncbi:MAG: ABC transporter permease subunit [Gemmatimonadetes bacterium]|nr:ABC transporter permease subunit [Gemmatimonadota bacterium]MYH18939.1 ABC transporter permease subunit [Gemmatimonadota bacterium]MYK98759.1 ABC transporter permease subunit [Gemmatimonadota bacterium]